MPGYASLAAPCYVCGKLFASHPHKVPSYQNEPICRECMDVINQKRKAQGIPEVPIDPDAYEACPEEEL